ncbi:putative nucleotidyltransferase with HDIG domain [Anaerosolibacter carboniphilus]|uniref:Putative nucleotidyltransferase with HDIG domain n=2 Tax=Anaerosolibacter carboniphilus TaxID=1417629 RepID=A0A841KY75_9FIRM|nr:putative nucleotidyltransferase with HDIG domain [Anaerosolibacter carboniphilus]
MSTKYVAIYDLRDGDILAEDIHSEQGMLIIAGNVTVNGYIKKRLLDLGISAAWIYSKNVREGQSNSYETTKSVYLTSVLKYKRLVNDLAKGNPFRMEEIKHVADLLYSQINNAYYIIKNLNELNHFDEYTYSHSVAVAFYAMLIGKWLKYSTSKIKDLILAGLLHDIGKIKIPQSILNKPGKLLPDEYEEVKKHVSYGYDIMQSIGQVSSTIKDAILTHHEREDGSGYPFGLKSDLISKEAKIIAIADVYDAVTSNRVYQKKINPFSAFLMFKIEGIQTFDIAILNKFLNNISSYYIGEKALLNNGNQAEIVFVCPNYIGRPVIRIGEDYVDLSQVKELEIIEII